MEGYLQKRIDGLFRSSHKRWVEVDIARGAVQWRRDRGQPVKKRVELTTSAIVHTANTLDVVSDNGTGQILATFVAEPDVPWARWVSAFESAAAAARGRLTLQTPSANDTLATSAAPDTRSDTELPLPDVVIDGIPEVGKELRLRVATSITTQSPGQFESLESLCLQWVRVPVDAPPLPLEPAPAPNVDLCAVPGVRSVPGAAVGECLVVTDGDVNFRLGCSVRRAAAGSSSRWTLLSTPAVARPTNAVRIRAELLPHTHTKYCDRRVRVCTSSGRYREGAVIRAVPVGPAELLAGFAIVWYRCSVRQQLREQQQSARGAADETAALKGVDGHRGTIMPPVAPARAIEARYGACVYSRVIPRPVAHLPPAPSDAEPSLPVGELKPRLALLHTPWPPPGAGRGALAETLPRADAVASGAAVAEYPLFVDDVDALIICALVPINTEPPELLPASSLDDAVTSDDAPLRRTSSQGADDGSTARPTLVSLPPASPTSAASAANSVGGGVSPQPRPPTAARRATSITAMTSPGMPQLVTTAPVDSAPGADSGASSAPSLRQSQQQVQRLPSALITAPAVGPIEAAPPRARETWIEGVARVGETLTGHVYYHGGRQVRSAAVVQAACHIAAGVNA